jgi:hypothetical protein
MKTLILIFTVILATSVSKAQSFEQYICTALDGDIPDLVGGSIGNSKDQATAAFLNAVENYHVTKASCKAAPKIGTMSDLAAKKWGFQGLKSNEFYLMFNDNQILQIQECGTDKQITKFNAEVIGEGSLKLSLTGTEGSCNPVISPVFQTGSIVTFEVMIYDDQPATLTAREKRPEEISRSALYQEMK